MTNDEAQLNLQQEQIKSKIFEQVDPDIKNIVQDEKLNYLEKWGAVFEILVRAELSNAEIPSEEYAESKEYKAQELLKSLVEEMYSDINVVLGLGEGNGDSKPDGIIIGFENKKLVIQKVIEMKSSSEAYEHAIADEQPLNTIKSLTKLVNIFNQIMHGDQNIEIKPEHPRLSEKESNLRNEKLNKIRNVLLQVKRKLPETEKIVFSENLEYHLIFPKNEIVPSFTADLLEQYFYAIPVTMENSMISKNEISNFFLKHSIKK